MKNLFAIILNLSIICVAFGTSHSASYWANSYGGTEFDTPTSILQTSEGGYIVVGGTTSFGVSGQAGLVLKLDEVGDVVWRRVIDISTSSYDSFYSVLQTSDGGYIVAGATYLEYSPLILKLNASGNIVWNKLYQRVYGQQERPKSIQHTTDGGYIVAGSTYYDTGDWDIWVMKLDASGNISWRRTYIDPKKLRIGSIQQTHDGGYVIVGYVDPGPGGDFSAFIAKLDIFGFPIWGREFGHNDDKFLIAHTVIQTPDDGYLVAGSAEDFGVWVVKLGSSGNIIHWQKGYGDGEAPRSIQLNSDGSCILTGAMHISGPDYDTYVLKISGNGNALWKRLYGGEDKEGFYDICIQETTDLGYVIAGDLRYNTGDDVSDMMVIKTDNVGEIPGCNIISTGTATATNSDVPSSYFFLPNPPDSVTPTVITDISITSQQPSVEKTILCSLVHAPSCEGYCGGYSPGGCWCDEVCHDQGDCCDDKCDYCPNPEDNFPPGGNNCGDECECEGDFDNDGDQDGSDAFTFKVDFGRSSLGNPCVPENPCNGNFNCDEDVDGSDAFIFKEDFGRSSLGNPCHECVTVPWCE